MGRIDVQFRYLRVGEYAGQGHAGKDDQRSYYVQQDADFSVPPITTAIKLVVVVKRHVNHTIQKRMASKSVLLENDFTFFQWEFVMSCYQVYSTTVKGKSEIKISSSAQLQDGKKILKRTAAI